ncbi:MAG: metallophosphoesterase [Armatimonadetes bacterium]|nr:metallophosphoesterase [Armatimonadota bacterium]
MDKGPDEAEVTRDPAISRRKFLRCLAGAGGVLGGLGVASARCRFNLQVTHQEIALPGLPVELAGLTIAQLSDLHHSPWIPREYLQATVERCNALAPDIVCLTGDFVAQSRLFARPCAEVVGGLRARLGVFAVLGNHDHWESAEAVTEAVEDAGIEMLTNRGRSVVPGLHVAGIDDVWAGRPDVDAALRQHPWGEPLVLLSHNPRGLDRLPDLPCLVLAGHTHAGQIAIPGLPRKLPPDMKGTPYVEGWYDRGRARMYISRGVGMVFPPVRLHCPPEMTIFRLVRA